MLKFNILLLSLILIGNLAHAQPLALKQETPAKTGPFEQLIDVDYGFFMTKAKLPWGIDPFTKEPGFIKVDSVDEKFVLTGILYSKEEPRAIVNGLSVGPGDTVGDRHVTEIGENFVILKKQESEIELNLPPVRDPASESEPFDDDEESGE